jgi:hypothetical protein
MKLTTYLHVVLRLRMSGPVPLLPLPSWSRQRQLYFYVTLYDGLLGIARQVLWVRISEWKIIVCGSSNNVLLTNCVELSYSWEASGCSVIEEIFCCFWKVNIHYHVHNSPLLHYTKRSLSFEFCTQNSVHIFYHYYACYMSHPSCPPWGDRLVKIW